jgi:type I restriction enzyme S subunit
LIKVRFNPVELGNFVLYWLLSNGGRSQITIVASSTSGLYTLSLSKVAVLAVPLPPLLEQKRIIEKIERRLSVADEIEKELDQALVRSGRLRQAVLKSAFEGRLV